MTEKKDGAEKPFYENIVSRRRRAPKPTKADREKSAPASSEHSSQRRDNDASRPRSNDAGRPRSNDASRPRSNDAGRPRSNDAGRPRSNDASRPRSNDAGRPRGNGPRPIDPSLTASEARRPSRHTHEGADRYPRREGGSPRRETGYHAQNNVQRESEKQFAQEELRREKEKPEPETRAPRKPFAGPKEGAPVFGALPPEVRSLLESFPAIVDAVIPLDSRKIQNLPAEIRGLSHELTDERGERRVGYMNDPAVLSAYIRYYMWWNLVRLSRLFVSLPLVLNDGDAAVDLGSGPLTLPIALWMARPDLRDRKLTWYCVDISQGALAAGEELFLSLAAKTGNEPWQIVRIKGECGVSLRRSVSLVASANMFNELFWENPLPLEAQAAHHAGEIASYASPDSSVLVVEPGVPRSGRFISLLRDSLMKLDFKPVSPCPHDGDCPFPGLRYGKWCHFVFDTTDAPAKLHKLSEDAGLVKDRAALSFIFARRATVADQAEPEAASLPAASATEMLTRMTGLFPPMKVRIASDPIRLPDFHTGRYGCTDSGMVLVTGTYQAADYLKECASGSLIEVETPDRKRPERDPKTGAIIIRLK